MVINAALEVVSVLCWPICSKSLLASIDLDHFGSPCLTLRVWRRLSYILIYCIGIEDQHNGYKCGVGGGVSAVLANLFQITFGFYRFGPLRFTLSYTASLEE